MSGTEFVPADFNLGRGGSCGLSDAGEPADNVGSPSKSKGGGMFASTFSKVMVILSVIMTVVMVYLYMNKKNQTAAIVSADTEHEAVLQQTTKEDLQRMLDDPSSVPTKDTSTSNPLPPSTSAPAMTDQMKQIRQNILQEFSPLVEIPPNTIMELPMDKVHMIINAKRVYENMHKDENTFPAQSQILTLMYAKKILVDLGIGKAPPPPPPVPVEKASDAATTRATIGRKLASIVQTSDESIADEGQGSPVTSTGGETGNTATQKSVAFNLDNIDSDEDE